MSKRQSRSSELARGIYSTFGIIRTEVIFNARTGMLVMSVIMPLLLTVGIGLVVGLQGMPIRGIPVGLYQEDIPGILPTGRQVLNSSESLTVTRYGSIGELNESIFNGWIVAGLVVQRNETSGLPDFWLLVDDTKAAVSRAAVATILKDVASATGVSGRSFQIESRFGLDTDSDLYLIVTLAPGLVTITVLYVSIAFAGLIFVREREQGTVFELALAPVSRKWIILGKMLSPLLLLCLDVVIISFLAATLFGSPFKGDVWSLMLLVIISGIGMISMTFVLSSLIKSTIVLRAVVGIPLFLPMMLLSGALYPVQSLPWILQVCSYLNPLMWLNTAVNHLFFRGGAFYSSTSILFPLILLSVFGAVMIVAGSFLLGRLLRE
jgi:ABC-2 type transport system permease protein